MNKKAQGFLGGKYLAIIMLVLLAAMFLRQYLIYAIIVVGVLYLIRLIADLYWWGKDKDKW